MGKISLFTASVLISSTFLAGSAVADAGYHGCTADAGLATPAGAILLPVPHDEPVVNLGGCELHHKTEAERTVISVEEGDGCQIRVDQEFDGFYEKRSEESEVYPAGTAIAAFCDAGTMDVTNSITLE